MTTQTKIGIVLVLLLIVLGAVRLGVFSKGPSDEEAIKTAMADAIQGAKDGRSGPVLDFLSDQLELNGQVAATKAQIAHFVRENHPAVKVLSPKPTVSGDTATIVSTVRVSVSMLGSQQFEQDLKDVTLTFRREDTTEWLIFPGKTWRLSKVSAPDAPNMGEPQP